MTPSTRLAALLVVVLLGTTSGPLVTPLGEDVGADRVRASTDPAEAAVRPGPRPNVQDHGSIPHRSSTAPAGPPTATLVGRVLDASPSAAPHAVRAVLRI